MRLYALVEAGDPEAIDVYLCEQDAQRALEGLPQGRAGLARAAARRGDRVRRHAAIRELKIAAFAGGFCSRRSAQRRLDDSDKGCNVRLKGLKKLGDPQRKLVNLHPKNTTLAAIRPECAEREFGASEVVT